MKERHTKNVAKQCGINSHDDTIYSITCLKSTVITTVDKILAVLETIAKYMPRIFDGRVFSTVCHLPLFDDYNSLRVGRLPIVSRFELFLFEKI